MINNESGFLSKKLLIIIGIILVLLAGGAFAYLKFFSSGGGVSQANTQGQAPAPAQNTQPQPTPQAANQVPVVPSNLPGPVFDLDTFIVNLLDDSGRRYLKSTIKLELSSQLLEEEIKQKMPEIRDNILVLLSSKSYEAVADTAGKLRLRTEIINRLNNIMTTGKINKVYFTEFVIQ